MKKPWAKVKPGDVLDLDGRAWTVEKIKPGKKKAEVKIRHKSNVVRDTVKLADKVRISDVPPPRAAQGSRSAPASTKPVKQKKRPPEKASGDPWETQQDRIEKQLGQILGARLVGEATAENAGYYVPLVDITTVAAHMVIYHGTDITDLAEIGMLKLHEQEHAEHLDGKRNFLQNHWHTEKRPTTGKKKGKS